MRGLKNTLIAGMVLIKVRAASCSSANRSTEIPPPRPPPPAAAPPPPEPPRPRPPPIGSPKVIEPVTPTENSFQLLPENGNAKFFSVAWPPAIWAPNSGKRSEEHTSELQSLRH